MKKSTIIVLLTLVVLLAVLSCTPYVKVIMLENYERKPVGHEVVVYALEDDIPANSKIIGFVEIGDRGTTINCGYDEVVNLAKERAILEGADAIQITDVSKPSIWSTCYQISAVFIAFIDISDWPRYEITENMVREYLDHNADSLDKIEGIWNANLGVVWNHPVYGETKPHVKSNAYRLAIMKDTTSENYQFRTIVLESEYEEWEPGFLKAKLRKTAYESIYDGIWYMQDFEKNNANFSMDESGLLKSRHTNLVGSMEVATEVILMKAYPVYADGQYKLPELDKEAESYGSGFLLSKFGYVVTNYHVVEDAEKIEVILPDKNLKFAVKVEAEDKKNDIVILRMNDLDLPDYFNREFPFSLGNSDSVKVGEEVFTLGYPIGNIMGTSSRLSTGVVNSLYGIQDDDRLFQISNPVLPGNSGGPLFNSRGEVVGLVVSSLNAKLIYQTLGIVPQNVNFAIKAQYLENLIQKLKYNKSIFERVPKLDELSLTEKIEILNPYIVQIYASVK
ncbi:MAG: trypsin-like peptidase domain-containing protein [Candidatus Zixiibacteriota bacterium]|nr:MAG: trypsin-like peptidase domain-containing protein [candidate division Zixibacteria bacterium]